MVNLFIVYELDTWSSGLNNDVTLKDCLFGYIKLKVLIQINTNIAAMA